MADIAQSNIYFGEYLFPIGTMVKSRSLASDVEATKMLGLDGEIAPTGLAAAQIITLEVDIGGGGDWDPASTDEDVIYVATPDDLNSALNDMYAAVYDQIGALTIGYSPARTIQAQHKKFDVAYTEGTGRRNARVSLDFFAPDPRWLAVAATTITSGTTATNNGNMPTYPVVTYTQSGGAASVVPSLQIDTGAGYVELILSLPILGLPEYMQAGDVLVINCDPRARSQGIIYTPASTGIPVNGLPALGTVGCVNTIGNDACFPYLLPGAHTIAFAGANSIAFVFNDAYAL
jgi:hypothetical protein